MSSLPGCSSPYAAVLFDLDGTVCDTAADLVEACNQTLQHFGLHRVAENVLRTRVTSGMRVMLRLGVPADKEEQYDVEGAMRDYFAAYYTAHIADKTTVFAGMDSLIARLHEQGLRTGIITNKYADMAHRLLHKFSFAPCLDIVLGGDSCSQAKPHTEPLLTAMRELKVSPDRTLYVGDHLNDIQAAINAGCHSCCALWGYGGKECGDPHSWHSESYAASVPELTSLIWPEHHSSDK